MDLVRLNPSHVLIKNSPSLTLTVMLLTCDVSTKCEELKFDYIL